MFSKTIFNETVDTGDVEGIKEMTAFCLDGVDGAVVAAGVVEDAEDDNDEDDEDGREEIYNSIWVK